LIQQVCNIIPPRKFENFKMPLRENNKIDGATCKKQLVPYCYASPKFLATTWLPEPHPLVLPENTK
jgi:hypothetical protein